ncbi:MAG: FtsX-like permease family protein [Microthrixaceae bacterium]
MNIVWFRVAGLLRRGWVATVVLTVLLGLAAGIAMAAVAAGRRTATAFDRMLTYAAPPSLNLTFCPPALTEVDETSIMQCFLYDPAAEREVIADLPVTEAVGLGLYRGVMAANGSNGRSTPATAFVMRDDSFTSVDGREIIVSGRWARPDRAEVVVNERMRDLLHLAVGDEIDLSFWADDELGDPGRIGSAFHGPRVTVPVVGITRGILDLSAVAASAPGLQGDDAKLVAGPGLARATPDAAGFSGVFVRGRPGSEASLHDAVQEAFPGRPFNATPTIGDDEQEPIREAIRYEADGTLALGVLGALAVAVFAGQTIGRQSRREWSDQRLLRAMGCTSGQISSAAALRGLSIGAPAAAFAGAIAVALSPLGPVGVGRMAETSPGVAVDGIVLSSGMLLVVALTVLAAWSPVRSASTRRTASQTSQRRPVAHAWLPPVVAAGVHMARPARRGPGLPMGTAVTGVALAVGILAAAGGLTSSLDALRSTPARYGAPWDVAFGGGVSGPDADADARQLVAESPDVAAASMLRGTDIAIADHVLWVHAFEAFPGVPAQIPPPIIEGRAPVGLGEIALGRITMDDLGVSLGDHVEVQTTVSGSAPSTLTVVGTAIINDIYEESPGRGGIVSPEWIAHAAPEVSVDPHVVQLRPGADVSDFEAELAAVFDGRIAPPVPQTSIRNVERIRELPFALAAAVGALALAAFAHALVLSVRRNRQQLGVLQALGFTPRQAGRAVASHATSIALVSVAVGLPLGVVLGRWGWRMVAERIGLVGFPVTPLMPLVVTCVGVVLVANLVALGPAWRVRRASLTEVLRTE